uniref:Serpentine Receptor, class T n=1 Tax=Panagrellus redivivus TaxID=6233 RepID=A0A7E4VYH8_PANRE
MVIGFEYFWLKPEDPQSTPIVSEFFLDRSLLLFIMLIGNVISSAFVDYVILTQSSSLNYYKYCLLNQTIWTQFAEIMFLFGSPVLLSPYLAGFPSGFLRNIGTPIVTAIFTEVFLFFYLNSLLGVFLTLMNRFIAVFHSELEKWFHSKVSIVTIAIVHILIDGFFLHCIIRAIILNTLSDIDTGKALEPWFREKGLINFPEYGGYTRTALFFVFCFVGILFFVLVGTIIWFICKVFIGRKTSKILNKHSTSLLLSALVQAGCCIIFSYIPMLFILYCWSFAPKNSANASNIALAFFSVYGTVDMLCTLYFVKPYRQYCWFLVDKYFILRWKGSQVTVTTST